MASVAVCQQKSIFVPRLSARLVLVLEGLTGDAGIGEHCRDSSAREFPSGEVSEHPIDVCM
jgi:hypothetical protein